MLTRILALAILAGAAHAGDPDKPFRYLERATSKKGDSVLRTAVKTFVPAAGGGPSIHLVAVAHIGETDYYAAIQKRLDACEVVLYEGVGVPLFKTIAAKGCDAPKEWTRTALLYLRDIVVWYRNEMGTLPNDYRRLRLAVKLHDKKDLAWVDRARTDAWGRPFIIQIKKGVCSVQSLGRDGLPGGKGRDADMMALVTDTTRRSDAGGLQRRLANALGLRFQLDVIDYSRPSFVNSDMTVAKLRELTAETKQVDKTVEPPVATQPATEPTTAPAKPSPAPQAQDETQRLLAVLQGDNPAVEWLSSLCESLLVGNEKGQEMVKWMLCEVLSAAEAMMENLTDDAPTEEFAGTAKMMRILILDRNAIVMRDLKRTIKEHPNAPAIAVFYGAGHMGDLEKRLANDLRYEEKSLEWLSAFSADPKKAGITDVQALSLRKKIAEQIEIMK